MILFLLVAVISFLVQYNLKKKTEKYSRMYLSNGMTGKDIAEKMLRDNGLTDVKVCSIGGQLTDHYNPETKIVNLSESVYGECTIMAAAVAAHECGHAVQHACGYSFLKLRSALVPAVNFASNTVQWVILGGLLLIKIFPYLLAAGIALFAITTLFSFITLPVEIDASARAVSWLERANITDSKTKPDAVAALRAAAYTYIVAALSSLVSLLYYLRIFLNRR